MEEATGEGPPRAQEGREGVAVVDEAVEVPEPTVEELQKQLEFFKSENERKQKELEEITQVCRAVMEKLHVLTCHINDKEKEEEVERLVLHYVFF